MILILYDYYHILTPYLLMIPFGIQIEYCHLLRMTPLGVI